MVCLAADLPGAGDWAFRAPVEPPFPQVFDCDWPARGVDYFVLAALESEGLAPTAPAQRRTLIRRLSLDLTGLPPTAEEILDFLKDTAAGAYERLVDRLLASPRYGERWGRHWLDVARYADSNGLDENIAHGNAWRYRDYVIDAFNTDLPYDRFVVEQLAGDLLLDDGVSEAGVSEGGAADRFRRVTATGFLSLGPKVLAEGDVGKLEMDIIDEQLDTLGRAFLGLTFGCARCHDHKFDPIQTKDYYALAGIFKSTRTMESLQRIARWHENSLASPQEEASKKAHEESVAALKAEVARFEKSGDGETLQGLRRQLKTLVEKAPVLPAAMGVTEGEVADLRVHQRGSHLDLGESVARGVPAVFTSLPRPRFGDKASGRRELAEWIVSREQPLTARVMVNRIWRWHFGTGLVRTTDNFGVRGESPSHPELLDWLALRFMESGWSVKTLHRLLLTSSTYRQASDYDTTSARVDPQNRLLWHFPVRRLEAEAIRDSLLSVADALDLTMGASLLPLKNRQFVFDHTSRDATNYESYRRSVYLPVIRNHVYDFFALFDYPDPSVLNGDRATTTVPSQALLLMNSEFLGKLYERTARRVAQFENVEVGLRALYVRAFGRHPEGDELADALAFVTRSIESLRLSGMSPMEAEQRSWEALCQVLLLSNELFYVR
jgi:hypothetical protein